MKLLPIGLIAGLCLWTHAFADVTADDCPDMDLNAPSDSPFRKMAVYDQDGSGTCYAYVAAQLIDYYRIQHGAAPSDRINPIYAAWVYSFQDRSWLFRKDDTGTAAWTYDAIKSLRSQGYCKSDRVQASLDEFKRIGAMTDAQLLHFLESLYDNRLVLTQENTKTTALENIQKGGHLEGCRVETLAHFIHAKGLMNAPATKVLADLFEGCQPPTPLSEVPIPHQHDSGSDAAIRRELDLSLNNGNPAGIGVCSKVLENPSYRGLLEKREKSYNRFYVNNMKKDCEGHVAIVSGRKKINGSCRYLIRNTWGALWRVPDIYCACISTNGNYFDICPSSSIAAEYVGCWYKAEDLLPNTRSIISFYSK